MEDSEAISARTVSSPPPLAAPKLDESFLGAVLDRQPDWAEAFEKWHQDPDFGFKHTVDAAFQLDSVEIGPFQLRKKGDAWVKVDATGTEQALPGLSVRIVDEGPYKGAVALENAGSKTDFNCIPGSLRDRNQRDNITRFRRLNAEGDISTLVLGKIDGNIVEFANGFIDRIDANSSGLTIKRLGAGERYAGYRITDATRDSMVVPAYAMNVGDFSDSVVPRGRGRTSSCTALPREAEIP